VIGYIRRIKKIKFVGDKMGITKELKVSDVFREYPGAKQALIARGICDCCGGDFTLEETAKNKNIDLDALLQELEKEISDA